MMMMIYHGNVSSNGHVGVSEDVGGWERSKLRRGVELPPGHCKLYHDVYDDHHDDHLDDDYDDDDFELLPDHWDYDCDSGGDHDPDGDIALSHCILRKMSQSRFLSVLVDQQISTYIIALFYEIL